MTSYSQLVRQARTYRAASIMNVEGLDSWRHSETPKRCSIAIKLLLVVKIMSELHKSGGLYSSPRPFLEKWRRCLSAPFSYLL